MLIAAKHGFKEDNSLQANKILVGFLTSQDVFFKLLSKGKKFASLTIRIFRVIF